MGKFEITKRKNGEFQFNLKASNGQVILASEGYTTKELVKMALNPLKRIRQMTLNSREKPLQMTNLISL
jgi:uncharacterized protein YegP (UPF0339 family)